MIPIRDQIPTRKVPVINYLLIGLNILIFLIQWLTPSAEGNFMYTFAVVPAQLIAQPNAGNIAHIFTSMFMHGGWLHLGGNMLYLWIFGDNVEDSMGHAKYLLFYLVGGVVASLAHIYTNPTSNLPMVGASGAIAAVLGAYLVLYPSSKVLTIIPLGFFLRLTAIPASIVLGLWFVLQLFNGVTSLGAADVAGVAFWAHIGGFVAGAALARLFASRRRPEYTVHWD